MSKYLTEADKARISKYKQWANIFDSAHDAVFIDDLKKMNKEDRKKYVVANLGSLISLVSADFLFGEELLFTSDDGKVMKQLDELRYRSRLDSLFWETSLEGSYMGDAYLKTRLDPERGGAFIEAVNPKYVRIETEPGNANIIKQFVIQWEIEINGDKYLRREIRERGYITNELWTLKGDEMGVKVDLKLAGIDIPDQQGTGVDGFLMVHIPNFKPSANVVYGRSDYHNLLSLFRSVNNRLTKDDHILDKHANPKLAVPPGVLDKNGKVRREAFEMFEVGMGQTGLVKPEYITWEGNLEASENHFDKLLKLVFLISETSPDIFGLNENMPESGKALRMRLMRTVAKVRRKKRYYRHALDEILYETGELERVNNLGPGFESLSFEFQDGLPTDPEEEAQLRHTDRAAGVVSLETAVKERNPDWTDEQVAEEVERIKDENAISIPTHKQSDFDGDEGDE